MRGIVHSRVPFSFRARFVVHAAAGPLPMTTVALAAGLAAVRRQSSATSNPLGQPQPTRPPPELAAARHKHSSEPTLSQGPDPAEFLDNWTLDNWTIGQLD